MRQIIIIALTVLNFTVTYCQVKGNIFVDFNPKISNIEADFLNSKFEKQRGDFDFKDTKIGFVFIENMFLTNKNQFYTWIIEQKTDRDFKLHILPDSIKLKTGGYDALILIYNNSRKNSKINQEKLYKAFSTREKSIPNNLYLLGNDTNPILTDLEAAFFNYKFSDKKKGFDFKGKKIGFCIGNNGARIWSKKDYFNNFKDRVSHNYSGSQDELLVLNEKQTNESGGYDAVLVSWSKILMRGTTNKMIEILK